MMAILKGLLTSWRAYAVIGVLLGGYIVKNKFEIWDLERKLKNSTEKVFNLRVEVDVKTRANKKNVENVLSLTSKIKEINDILKKAEDNNEISVNNIKKLEIVKNSKIDELKKDLVRMRENANNTSTQTPIEACYPLQLSDSIIELFTKASNLSN